MQKTTDWLGTKGILTENIKCNRGVFAAGWIGNMLHQADELATHVRLGEGVVQHCLAPEDRV